ncbi:hypothetical protein [Parasitella parasitica]|uniref:CCHC-type domain-containing protein n=1 Tax=Parasitella parasitica TaxID=35722 RepID=A0A0B7MP11_9FUNG|nr:hypothetical protein [Parasitella parasitica]
MVSSWTLGSRYAMIQQLEGQSYLQLSHTLALGQDQEEDLCHATFPEMPNWCRYCHDEGYTKFKFRKSLAHIICYNCNRHGHRQAKCDRPKRKGSNFPPAKKQKILSPPSEEASKLSWAPGGSRDQVSHQSPTSKEVGPSQFPAAVKPTTSTPMHHGKDQSGNKADQQQSDMQQYKQQFTITEEDRSDDGMETDSDSAEYHPSSTDDEKDEDDNTMKMKNPILMNLRCLLKTNRSMEYFTTAQV